MWLFRSAVLLVVLGVTAGCTVGIIEVDNDAGTDAATDAGADADNDSGADPGSDAGADPGSDPGADPGQDAGADPGADSDPNATLIERLNTVSITVPEGVKAGVSNWRIWGRGSLSVAPVFSVPLANCQTLIGYTTNAGGNLTARATRLDASDQLVNTFELGSGYELRGLAAEADGHFAALLWDDGANKIYIRRFDLSGSESWTTELINTDNAPDDFLIGDSRMEYGDGKYGAYYHVHSNSGHEGDTLKWASIAGNESTSWTWGCSHSMSNLLRFNPATTSFLPVCVTDCYPGTSGDLETNSQGGIYLNHRSSKVIDLDAGCNGSVAGEIGGAALSPSGWALVFNTHQNPMTLGQSSYNPSTMNQDIGFSTIAQNLSAGTVVWLTDTDSINEADSTIARWQPAGDASEQYVVGWNASNVYWLSRIDSAGTFLEGPLDISSVAKWGRRDDPLRQHFNKDIVWAWFDSPGSTTLHFARLTSGAGYECASF
ncbi:MAG: hypothetical protein JRJ87_12165 [Deltaproteobacteria bacterium]|nr:hypothetical protein [Deltaproteobacteria bacterium]